MRTATRLRETPGEEGHTTVDDDPIVVALEQFLTRIRQPRDRAEIVRAVGDDARADPLRALVDAAGRLGVALDVEPATRERLERCQPPFLVVDPRSQGAHCVESRLGGDVFYADPGHRRESVRRLAHADVALLMPAAASAAAPSVAASIRARLRPVIAEIAVASVVINLLALATPLFMMTVYNKVIGHGAMQTLDVLALGMLTLFAFDGGLRLLRGHVMSHAGARVDAAVGGDIVDVLLRLPLPALQKLTPGQMVEQLRQIDNLRLFFTGQVPLLWVDLGFVVLFMAVIALLAPPLALITLAAVPLVVLASGIVAHRQRQIQAEGFTAAADKAAVIGETVTNALTMKSLGLEPAMARQFDDKLAAAADAGFRGGWLNGAGQTVGLLLQHLTALVLVYVGAHLIVVGELSVGALIAATILSARALAPLRQLAGAGHQLHAVGDAMRAIDRLLAGAPAERATALTIPTLAGALRLENVSFRYDGHRAALRAIDLEVGPGEMLAVIGPPGSGKTTLTKILLGLLEPSDGRVLVDGFDLRHLPSSGYLRQIGYVPQETQLFRGSIAYNLAIGSDTSDVDRLVAAARFTGLHEIVEALPEGYGTVLGDGRFNLSTGQRQLLALARALVRNPRILIFDEATSALDAASERRLVQRLEPVVRGRTMIMVTHRPALLALATHGLRLDHGRIVDRGPMSEVLARSGGALPAASGV